MFQPIKRPVQLFVLCLLILGAGVLFPKRALAENFWRLSVEGRLLDQFDQHTLNTGIIQVYRNGSRLHLITSGKEGQFTFELDREGDYTLVCSKPGYFEKKIGLSTKGVSSIDRAKSRDVNSNYKFQIDVTLFREVKEVDVSVLKEPIGSIFFDQGKNNFSYEVNDELAARLEALTKKVEEIVQVQEKVKEQQERTSKMNAIMSDALEKAKARQNNLSKSEPNSDHNKTARLAHNGSDGSGASPSSENDPSSSRVQTEVIGGPRCTITKTRVTHQDRITEFREIRYNWGAVYYKKNDADITDLNYRQYMRVYNVK